MSEQTLREALHDSVRSEPAMNFDVDRLIRRARREDGRRRVAWSAGVAAVAIAAAVVIPKVTGPAETSPAGHGQDALSGPGTGQELNKYLHSALPSLLPGWQISPIGGWSVSEADGDSPSTWLVLRDADGSTVLRVNTDRRLVPLDVACHNGTAADAPKVTCTPVQTRPDGSRTFVSQRVSGGPQANTTRTAYHLRADGTSVVVSNSDNDTGQGPGYGGARRDRVPITDEQLLAVATDLNLHP